MLPWKHFVKLSNCFLLINCMKVRFEDTLNEENFAADTLVYRSLTLNSCLWWDSLTASLALLAGVFPNLHCMFYIFFLNFSVLISFEGLLCSPK